MKLPLFLFPAAVRLDAKVNVVCAGRTAADTVVLLGMVEREILAKLAELRQLRDKRDEVCEMAAEAELRFARAADHYKAVHVEAVPWSEQTDHYAEAAE